jgi:RAB protein geranylgeranyltransferase component A
LEGLENRRTFILFMDLGNCPKDSPGNNISTSKVTLINILQYTRLSAIYGGTYMLDKKITGIEYHESGKVSGVRCEDGLYRANMIIGDPSYFPNRVQKVGQVIRAICFLKAPIPSTTSADSVQIIIPQRQVKRKYGLKRIYF